MTATKGHRTVTLGLSLLLFLFLFTALAWAAPAKTEIYSPRVVIQQAGATVQVWRDEVVSGQLCLTLSPTVSAADFQAMLDRQGGQVLSGVPSIRWYVVSLPAGMSVVDGVLRWAGEGGVAVAAPDRVHYLLRTPNDPRYPAQWQWPRVNAPLAWDVQTGSPSTVVAIIDTGLQFNHEDLSAKIWSNTDEIAGNGIDDDGNGYVDDTRGWNFVAGNYDPQPHPTDPNTQEVANHGLHVGGLVGAATDNSIGVSGQDWNCRLMACKVFDDNGGGCTDAVLVPAIMYAVDNGANVINMSLGGYGVDPNLDPPISHARDRGCVVVCAAGNSNWEFTDDPGTWFNPICNDGPNPKVTNWVFGVAATDSADKKCGFSNYDGSSTKTFVDVSAPGAVMWSCFIYDPAHGFTPGYGQMQGTSMASPVAAGLVALVHAQHPGFDPLTLINQIKSTTDNIDSINPIYAGKLGTGRINDANALGVDLPPGPPRSVAAGDTPGDQGGSISVSWSKSVDDGKGQKDVKDYVVYRADNIVVGGVDKPDDTTWALKTIVLVGHLLGYLDTPVANHVKYWYKVSSRDAANEVFSKATGPAFARDDLAPPAVTSLYAADTQADDGGSVSLSWPGYTAPADFVGFHIYRARASFLHPKDATLLQTFTGDPGLSFYQDTTTTDGLQYWYAVAAFDGEGNEVANVTVVGPVVSQPNFALSLPAGISMFAIGATPLQTNMADLLGIARADLRLLRYDPVSNAYHIYQSNPNDSFLQPLPGRGFWIALASPLVLDLGGQPLTTDPTLLPCSSGWNQLGNPYLHDMPWQNLTVRSRGTSYTLAQSNTLGITRDFAWTYDPYAGAYRLVTPMVGFGDKLIAQAGGFWFLAFETCSLAVSAAAPASAGDVKPVAVDVAWKIKLTARSGPSADYDNYLGVSSAAALLNSIVSPPLPSGGPELYFVNPGVDGLAAMSFVAPTAATRWQARVKLAGLQSNDVEIAWPDLSSVPRSLRPILTDIATGKRVYMRTAASYRFTPSSGEDERAFEITMGQDRALQVSALSARPAGQGVEVVFTLSAPASVSGQVLNLSGRVVQDLPAVSMDAGTCRLQWTGRSHSGARAPAGQYLLRLTARTPDGQEVSGLAQARLGR